MLNSRSTATFPTGQHSNGVAKQQIPKAYNHTSAPRPFGPAKLGWIDYLAIAESLGRCVESNLHPSIRQIAYLTTQKHLVHSLPNPLDSQSASQYALCQAIAASINHASCSSRIKSKLHVPVILSTRLNPANILGKK